MKALTLFLLLSGFLSQTFGQPSSVELSQYEPPLKDAYITPVQDLSLVDDSFIKSPSTYQDAPSTGQGTDDSPSQQPVPGLLKGITYMARQGSPVYAVADGRYASIRLQGLQEGWCLQLRHANGIRSEYIALDHVQIEEGERVEKGALLGYTSEDQFHFRLKQKKEIIDVPAHFYQMDKIVVKAF